jgi:AcrR family transcriptional regulator
MCPRPRTASDADLLLAASRAVHRVGPIRLTLADVAAEAGVAPATLLQRFGSKRGLLLALIQMGGSAVNEEFNALRAAHPSPLAALRATAECMAGMATSPGELANHLAFLIMDLTDPEFHRLALEQARAFTAEMKAMLDAAVAANELVACETARLARLLQEALHGAMVTWAIYREGTALEWVRQEFDLLMAPYVVTDRRASAKHKQARRSRPRSKRQRGC